MLGEGHLLDCGEVFVARLDFLTGGPQVLKHYVELTDFHLPGE